MSVAESSGSLIAGVNWYDGVEGYIDPWAPTLAVAFANGHVQLMRGDADDGVCTSSSVVCCVLCAGFGEMEAPLQHFEQAVCCVMDLVRCRHYCNKYFSMTRHLFLPEEYRSLDDKAPTSFMSFQTDVYEVLMMV